MATAFKKGQLVTVLKSYDDKGTVTYQHAIVRSCGVKRMMLTDEATGNDLGDAFFNPKVGSLDSVTGYNWYGVFPRMADIDAEAACLVVANKVVALRKARYLELISERGDAEYYNKYIAELHEPRAHRRYTK